MFASKLLRRAGLSLAVVAGFVTPSLIPEPATAAVMSDGFMYEWSRPDWVAIYGTADCGSCEAYFQTPTTACPACSTDCNCTYNAGLTTAPDGRTYDWWYLPWLQGGS